MICVYTGGLLTFDFFLNPYLELSVTEQSTEVIESTHTKKMLSLRLGRLGMSLSIELA